MPKRSPPHCAVRSKIWIVDEAEEVVFGLGRLKILEAVERLGSIQAAAKALKMSYRAIWGRVRASEQRLGRPLLVRSGGGSHLTPYARRLLERYRSFHGAILAYADRLLEEHYGELFGRSGSPPDPDENA
jgi:molybdate transport system regulatory protein